MAIVIDTTGTAPQSPTGQPVTEVPGKPGYYDVPDWGVGSGGDHSGLNPLASNQLNSGNSLSGGSLLEVLGNIGGSLWSPHATGTVSADKSVVLPAPNSPSGTVNTLGLATILAGLSSITAQSVAEFGAAKTAGAYGTIIKGLNDPRSLLDFIKDTVGVTIPDWLDPFLNSPVNLPTPAGRPAGDNSGSFYQSPSQSYLDTNAAALVAILAVGIAVVVYFKVKKS